MKHSNNATKKADRLFAAYASATVSAILCCAMLAFLVSDCESYKKEDSVPVSISFTEPEMPYESGFWDIISEAVIRLFNIGG